MAAVALTTCSPLKKRIITSGLIL